MTKLQFSFIGSNIVEFTTADSAVLAQLRDVHSRIPHSPPPPSSPHALIASLLGHSVKLVEGGADIAPAFRNMLAGHVSYHGRIIALHSPTDLGHAQNGFELRQPEQASAEAIRQCVGELLQHMAAGFDVDVNLAGAPPGSVTPDVVNPLSDLVPQSVLKLRTEAAFDLIVPWFMRSLEVPGDVCEFGCFRGTMSIKFAFALKALGIDKTVYAFDTFEGFLSDDPAGGTAGVGVYSANDDAFGQLSRWSKAIPVRPIKGDATQTCKMLKATLSFVWLDLDHGSLMRPVFETIRPLLTDRTILGVDDVGRIDGAGRPITPGVEPWVDELVAAKRLVELERHQGAYVRFYRVNK
jgi:hypothetical protein